MGELYSTVVVSITSSPILNVSVYELIVNEPETSTSLAGITEGISLHPEKVYPVFVGSASGVTASPKRTVCVSTTSPSTL